MRRLFIISGMAAFLSILFISCDKEEGPGIPPSGEGITESIIASPGDEITFSGTFTTEDHFNQITLVNTNLLLDKAIVFANEVSKYYLDYTFTILDETPFDVYDVIITAENNDGSKQDFTVEVNISSEPETTGLTSNLAANPGSEIVIAATVTDAQGIQNIVIQNTGVELDTTIELSNAPLSYELNHSHTVPDSAKEMVHQGQIIVTNVAGRSVTYNFEVNLSGEEITYTEMYAVGGIQWWTWNAEHAYTMLPDNDNQNWFEIIVPAWPEEGFNEIKFLGQLDWLPDNWGLVDNSNPSAGMLNDENSQAILLDAASSAYYPAYFNVRFNPLSLSYEVEEVDQAGAENQAAMYIVGAGFPDYPNLDWNPEEAIPMVKNPDGYGDHIFAIYGLNFSEDVSLKFIGQNDGWGPVDIGFDTDYIVDIDDATDDYQVQQPISWIPTKSGDGTADLKFVNQAGTYTVLYDHFAKRAIVWMEE